MKKILKISSHPSYNTYNNLGFAFSILDTLDIDYTNWLIAHFVNIYYRKTWKKLCFDMPYCYKWTCFKSNIIFYNSNKYDSFIDAIKRQLNKNRYIYLCVNEKYIPNRISFKKNNYIHDIYIYGYDDDKNVFLTAAYNNSYNCTQHFNQQEISYYDVFMAQKNKTIKNVFFSFELKSDYDFEKAHKNKVKWQLIKYFFPINKYSGINIYNFLYKQYKDRKILMLHSKIICEHINILSKLSSKETNDDFEELVILAKRLFFISLKYTLTYDDNLINPALLLIKKIKKREIEIFKNYFNNEFSKFMTQIFVLKYNKYF